MTPRAETVPLKVEKCVFGGDGLARLGDLVVLIPGVLPEEVVQVRITAEKRDFLRGRAEKILQCSPCRTEPGCPLYGICPGCVYRHCTFEAENALKNAQFADFAARAGFPEELLAGPLAPPPEDGYRTKMILHVNKSGGDVMIGYVGSDNQTVCPVTHCPLVHPEINALLARQLAEPAFRHSVHDRMSLTYRYTPHGGVLFYRNSLPRGTSWLKEETLLGTLSVPADGFFQVNPAGAAALQQELLGVLKEEKAEVFLDLYCGAGLFSAAAAEAGTPVIFGAEISADSVAAARYNLSKRGRSDAEFAAGDAARELPPALKRFAGKRLLAVLDPPRGGISSLMRQALAGLPEGASLVYISCHPATWSRDAAVLASHGFRPVRARMVNQFARTAHFEVFSIFRKAGGAA